MSNTPQIRFAGFTDAWEQRKVSEITEFHKQGFYTTEAYDESKKYYLLRGTDLTDNRLVLKGTPKIDATEKDYQAFKTQIGDFLIVRSGTVGTYGIVYDDIPAIFGSYLIDFRFDKSLVVNEFFGYFYQSDLFKNQLRQIIQQSANTNINAENIKSTSIKLPSLSEQNKIANFFTQLDSLITLHQRKCDALQKFKKSMLQKMFPQNGESVPEIRFAGFTDAWEQRKFSELTEIRSASRVHKDEWQSSGVPFYRSSDVMAALNGTENEKAFISEELYEKLSAVSGKLEKGDVLVTGGGSVGKPYIVPNNEPLYTKDADLLWIKNNENLDPYFVYTFFFSPTFTDYLNSVSHVGTIAHYTITQLGETPITLPCVSEQQKIGDYFRNLDFLITLHQRKLETLQKMKKSLLQKMFV